MMETQPLRLLVVDDDRHVREILSRYLSDEGYRIDCATTATQALDRISHSKPDLVLLDLRLPDGSGMDVLSAVRKQCACPVIVLTSCAAETDKVLGLELGADDYITKPFSPREVLARVRTVLRRARPSPARPTVQIRDLEVDSNDFEARLHGVALQLTKTEFRILALLASEPGRTFSRSAILDAVAGENDILDRTLDKHITNLRKKLEAHAANPEYILTVHGVGYKMAKTVQRAAAVAQ